MIVTTLCFTIFNVDIVLFQAWACSRSFNNLLSQFGLKSCFQYLIAGGDQALIVGKELPEDDPPQGLVNRVAMCICRAWFKLEQGPKICKISHKVQIKWFYLGLHADCLLRM